MANAPDVGGVGYQGPDTDAPANPLPGPDFTADAAAAVDAGEAAGMHRGSGDSSVQMPLPAVPFERP